MWDKMGVKHSCKPNLEPCGKGEAITVNNNNNKTDCVKTHRTTDSELQCVHL